MSLRSGTTHALAAKATHTATVPDHACPCGQGTKHVIAVTTHVNVFCDHIWHCGPGHACHCVTASKDKNTIFRPCEFNSNIFLFRPISPLLLSQLQELIQFVSDEKDARESLQELAGRLTAELEALKKAQIIHTPAAGKLIKNYKGLNFIISYVTMPLEFIF